MTYCTANNPCSVILRTHSRFSLSSLKIMSRIFIQAVMEMCYPTELPIYLHRWSLLFIYSIAHSLPKPEALEPETHLCNYGRYYLSKAVRTVMILHSVVVSESWPIESIGRNYCYGLCKGVRLSVKPLNSLLSPYGRGIVSGPLPMC